MHVRRTRRDLHLIDDADEYKPADEPMRPMGVIRRRTGLERPGYGITNENAPDVLARIFDDGPRRLDWRVWILLPAVCGAIGAVGYSLLGG